MASCQASLLSYQSRRVLRGTGLWNRCYIHVCLGKSLESCVLWSSGYVDGGKWGVGKRMRGWREWVLHCLAGEVLATSEVMAFSVSPYRLGPRICAYFIVFLQSVTVVKTSADDTKNVQSNLNSLPCSTCLFTYFPFSCQQSFNHVVKLERAMLLGSSHYGCDSSATEYNRVCSSMLQRLTSSTAAWAVT